MLTNLIGNAIKFTEQGSVVVRVELAADQQLKFSIQDTGIGIEAERLPLVFDAFTQADASMSRRFGGTGLGTTISKQLVELMGGQITVQSTEGVGSCFEFRVPLKAGKATSTGPQGYVPALPALTILIADDIPQNLELLKLLLQRSGHQVTAVTDGVEAVDAVQQHSFDLVLMDIQMPNLDGLQACRQIRQWEQQNNTTALPVIALTASVLDEDKTAAREAGMQGFASKPIDFAALCFEIARVLQIDVREPLSVQQQAAASDQLLDLPKALQLWGNLATYLPQLQQFLTQQLSALQLASQQLQAGNYSAVQQQAHAIKGVSANLGLNLLSKACAELEQAARQQQQQRSQDLLQKILLCWPKFEAEYTKLHMQLPTEQQAQSARSDDRQLAAMLNALQQSLQRHELEDQWIEQLSQYSGEHQSLLMLLLDAVNDFDFPLALQLLEQFRLKLEHGAV